MVHEESGPLGNPDFIFDTKEEAETELVKALKEPKSISKE